VYNDLVGHWKARNPQALERVNPANLDRAKLAELIERYGHPLMREVARGKELELNDVVPAPADLNDYRKCQIETAEEIRDLFVPHFYFGCEAEDPMIHNAFNTHANAFGARLNAVLGSDIGHWDVAEMAAILRNPTNWWNVASSPKLNSAISPSPIRWDSWPERIRISSRTPQWKKK